MTDPNRSEMNVPDNEQPDGAMPEGAGTPIEGDAGLAGPSDAPNAEQGEAAPREGSSPEQSARQEPATSANTGASIVPPPLTQDELPAPPVMEELAAPPPDSFPLESEATPASESSPSSEATPITESPPSAPPPTPEPPLGATAQAARSAINLGKGAGEGSADVGPSSGFGAAEPRPERMTPQVVAPRDPNTAFLLELILGLFGILGIGYLYVGRNEDGLIRLIGWIVYTFIAWGVIFALSFVVIGLCFVPFQIAIQIGVPVWSAIYLRQQMERGEI